MVSFNGSLTLLALALASCATTTGISPIVSSPSRVPLVPVVEDPTSLSEPERLGLEIFTKDAAAWRATDALGAAFGTPPPSRGATGWIVVPDGDLWKVRFITEAETAVYDVRVDVHSPEPPVAEIRDPPGQLSAEEAAMWRARRTAAASHFMRCSERYNTVVLPGEWEGSPAWVVYMLAATQGDEVVFGGHHRIHTSSDGTRILHSRALTKSCIRIPRSADTETMFITHLMDPEPIETHVFISLSHDIPLGVGTESGLWIVVEGRMWRESELDGAPEAAP